VVAADNFFEQRATGNTTVADPSTVTVDQNRLFVVLQFGCLLRFE
jgi:hypothetical protein